MNLYNYHSSPEQLDNFDKRHLFFYDVAYDRVKQDPSEKNIANLVKLLNAIEQPFEVQNGMRNILQLFPDNKTTGFKIFVQQLAKYSKLAITYATHIINDRFPAGEQAIMSVPRNAVSYAEYIIKDEWPEAEPSILASGNVDVIGHYIFKVLDRRWPEAELILQQNDWYWNSYKEDYL